MKAKLEGSQGPMRLGKHSKGHRSQKWTKWVKFTKMNKSVRNRQIWKSEEELQHIHVSLRRNIMKHNKLFKDIIQDNISNIKMNTQNRKNFFDQVFHYLEILIKRYWISFSAMARPRNGT